MRAAITTLLAVWLLTPPGRAHAQSDQVSYYHTDAIGSVRMVTDQSGQVVGRYDYLPFGDLWGTPPTSPDAREFAGKERDGETGFDYFGARYYASETGRFTMVDPVVPVNTALLDPQLWNRYTYVRNNPLRFTDPDGRCIWDVCVAEGTVYLVGAAAVATTAWLVSPAGQQGVSQVVNDTRTMITTAAGAIGSWFRTESQEPAGLLPERAGPVGHISPGEVAGKTPAEIDARARELGLVPKGPSPAEGRGSYVDPVTGEQRILSHPNDPRGPHGHVNDPAGNRIGPDGRAVPRASPDAHLPIRIPTKKQPDDRERELP
jgi:RHS repeat-associated protein